MQNLNMKWLTHIKILIIISFIFPIISLAETPSKLCLKGLCLGDIYIPSNSELKPLKYFDGGQTDEKCRNRELFSYLADDGIKYLKISVNMENGQDNKKIRSVEYQKTTALNNQSNSISEIAKIAYAAAINKYGEPHYEENYSEKLRLIYYRYDNNMSRTIHFHNNDDLNMFIFKEEVIFTYRENLEAKYKQCINNKYID